MLVSSIPIKMPTYWSAGAVAPYVATVPIPSQIGVTPGRASFNDGFPPLNFTAVSGGGIPLFGEDMNGVLQAITQWLRWAQAGAPITYDSSFQTSVGGYPNGALIWSATTAGLMWRSTADNNTTNPDSGGANWVPFAISQNPTYTQLLSGSGTYNPQANAPAGFVCRRIHALMVGGGGSGGALQASGTAVNGNNGTVTSLGGWTVNPGSAGGGGGFVTASGAPHASNGGAGGTGGSNGTGRLVRRLNGGAGATGAEFLHNTGTLGAALTYIGGGVGGTNPFGGENTPSPNSGAGSPGVGAIGVTNGLQGQLPGGGGGGEFVEFEIDVTPSQTLSYAVGSGGSGVTTGSSTSANGATGALFIQEIY